jgi:hypothetical protein
MPLYDFEDGKGPVPAHRHKNLYSFWKQKITSFSAEGGWVANTATVASTAYIDPEAWVFGNACVESAVHVHKGITLSGTAHLHQTLFYDGKTPIHLDRQYDFYVLGRFIQNSYGVYSHVGIIPEGADVFYYSE